MINHLISATAGIMIQFLDLPEEILLELIIRFLSISECMNLVSVRMYSIVATSRQRRSIAPMFLNV